LGLICLAPLVIGWWVNTVGVPQQAAPPAAPQKGDVVSSEQPHHRDTGTAAPRAPANGTELLPARMWGGSQLWVSNPAGHDAVATLVDADTASPVRVVYIQAMNKVCIRHIAPGRYELVAETGENWDPHHVRFQTGRHALAKDGPFQCIDVTAGHVTSGRCIDVSSTDDASRPKSNIVLGQ